VGLNLQHASVVVNMDLPWNPAVLEQRIGRVHRLGQRQPVRVVNFISQGTIEEGMLGVLKFKKSLFAGVLDGGEKEVFLGGSRLTKFMETVETATASIPEAVVEEPDEAPAVPERREPDADEAPIEASKTTPEDRQEKQGPPEKREPAPAPANADPWSGLLQAGMALLQQFAANGAAPKDGSNKTTGPRSLVQRDERTGEAYVKFPVPPPEVLDQALQALGALVQGLRR
jgi:superfamily II DNA/RNA helicase